MRETVIYCLFTSFFLSISEVMCSLNALAFEYDKNEETKFPVSVKDEKLGNNINNIYIILLIIMIHD